MNVAITPEVTDDWVATLRADKRDYIEKLRSGSLECTPQRLNVANHIFNEPDCTCEDICNRSLVPRANV